MTELDFFSIVGDRAEYRPRGEASVAQAVQWVTEAITRTRALGIRNLLVNITVLNGLESPSLATRYHFVHRWADAALGQVRIAFVSRPELIDPGKFGVVAASNIGLQGDVFVTEEEAIRWLDGGK